MTEFHTGFHRVRRILVALDASAEAETALETAAELAARLQAEVVGLFVEDINLLRLAALPFARELVPGSVRSRTLDPADMERSLRARAEAMKRHLACCAERARIHWSFQVRRGDILEELLDSALQADLVVLSEYGRTIVTTRGREPEEGLSTQVLTRCHCAVLKRGRPRRLQRPVVLFYDGSPASRHGVLLAAQLAGRTDACLHVLLPPAEKSQQARHEETVRELLRPAGLTPRFQHLEDLRATTVAQAVAAAGGDILITGAAILSTMPRTEQQRLEALLDEIHCDLLFVSEDGGRKAEDR